MRRNWTMLLAMACLIAAIGCGGDDNPAAPQGGGSGGGGTTTNGTMSAMVDGQPWTAVAVTGAITSGVVALAGSDVGGALGIGLGFIDMGTGTYTIGASTVVTGTLTASASSWTAVGSTGSGSIVVTTLTATRVAGTFSFTAVAAPGTSPATRTVTNGVFDMTL